MADVRAIQSVVSQTAIQIAATSVIVMTEAGAGPTSDVNTASLREAHRQRHNRLALKQPSLSAMLQTSM